MISVLGAVCGIGGGLFSTPLLHYGLRFELRRAIATSLALVTATAISATFAEFMRADSALPWTIVAAIAPAALLGTQLGYRMQDRLEVRTLKKIFCVLLTVVGLKMIFADGQTAALLDYQPDLYDHLGAALLGLCAGFVVPILGIGGGMLMVPGMLFVVPGLGYLGARATSLAVASFTASRSTFLHLRAGKLNPEDARWIAAGALLGAYGGVQLVHVGSVAAIGQVLLAIILLVSALRFGLDVLRLGRETQAD
ncbi:MAG: putative membrane protein YfcA [Planctomycetota bacterium]|jgi:uncharacterized membrane protein YfcA